jgi:Lrp/AsnC family leucine-responsive transcriptional regulator
LHFHALKINMTHDYSDHLILSGAFMQDVDKFDRAIIQCLAKNARASVSDIADEVFLSQSACSRRIQALERSGVLSRYTADLGQRALGYRVLALVDITLNTQADHVLRSFEDAVSKIDGIIECMLVSGTHDYRLKILCRDLEDYERIHRESVGNLPGVTNIISCFVLRDVPTRGLYEAVFPTAHIPAR